MVFIYLFFSHLWFLVVFLSQKELKDGADISAFLRAKDAASAAHGLRLKSTHMVCWDEVFVRLLNLFLPRLLCAKQCLRSKAGPTQP